MQQGCHLALKQPNLAFFEAVFRNNLMVFLELKENNF